MDEFDLIATRFIGPLRTPITERVHSNHIQECGSCGAAITPENDSGWEVFVDSTITQPECKTCYLRDRREIPKQGRIL